MERIDFVTPARPWERLTIRRCSGGLGGLPSGHRACLQGCANVRFWEAKRTSRGRASMSAFDPKRTSSGVCTRGETFQLSIEALRFFQKWRVTNALVPRRLRGLAVAQYVFSHRRQHQGVRPAVTNKDGHRDSFEDWSEIEFRLQ